MNASWVISSNKNKKMKIHEFCCLWKDYKSFCISKSFSCGKFSPWTVQIKNEIILHQPAPCTPPFLIGLVETESDFAVRSVETRLGRWVVVVAMMLMLIFFGFLRPDLSPWGYRIRCFVVALSCLIVRKVNFKVTNKGLLHQQVKIQG